LIQIKKSSELLEAGSKSANTAALGTLVKFSSRKRRVIRLIDTVVGPIARFLNLFNQRSPAVAEVRSILVIEYWNLGDIVMESPFLINLRRHYPNAHIVLLTSPKVIPLIANQGLVDEIIEVRVPWTEHYSRARKYNPFSLLWVKLFRILNLLRNRSFDLAFSARADLRDNGLMWLANVRRRVGYSFGGGGYFLTDCVEPDLRNPHFSNRWLRLLEHIGAIVTERQPRLRLNRDGVESAIKLLEDHGISQGDFLVGVHSGARSATRQWGETNFEEVAARLLQDFSIKIIWFHEPGRQPSHQLGKRVIPLGLPLDQFMSVLGQCRMLICNDSGPMHIAAALGVPVVAIFGPTEPTWFAPLGPLNRLVIRPGFWCRPCFDYCLFDQPYCLKTISVSDVYQAANSNLSSLLAKDATSEFAGSTQNSPRPEWLIV
jgi:heptosyltransferase II